jgi:3-deoxy-D-manno-octulosonic-acid transferase
VYKLYNFLLLVFSLGAFPIFLAKFVFTPQKRRVYAQKLGFFPRETLEKMEGEPRIWIHAVSLGEVGAIHPLVRELRKVYPGACLMVSTGTESGQKMARERLTEASGTFYFPWDCPRAVRKAIRRLNFSRFRRRNSGPIFSESPRKKGRRMCWSTAEYPTAPSEGTARSASFSPRSWTTSTLFP